VTDHFGIDSVRNAQHKDLSANATGHHHSIGTASVPTVFAVSAVATVLLVLAGLAYRMTAQWLSTLTHGPVKLPVPLATFPLKVGMWDGRDVTIPENILRVADNDDYLSRRYTNSQTHETVDLYIAYTAKPRTMVGHRPEVCYPAAGWIHDTTEVITVEAASGRTVPCLLHWFHRSDEEIPERIVLNFYIVNGKVTNDESVFTGLGWRTPNIAGDPARYVAQVQIAADLENAVRQAARDFTDKILEFLPDPNGYVAATSQFSGGEKIAVK